MLFSLFVRNADMPAGLSFLLLFFLRVMFVIARNAASWLAPSLKQYVKIERRKIEILFNIHY